MANTMQNNGHTQRKQLSTQIDRLDTILDGLAEALNESVADAVKDVVGQVVKETVETTIKEVLGNPDLLRSALAKHMPHPIEKPKGRTLKDVLKGALSYLYQKSCEGGHLAKKGVANAWYWCLEKVKQGLGHASDGVQHMASKGRTVCATTANVFRFAWNFKGVCLVALGVGMLVGIGSYVAGPVVASAVCGVSSSVMTLVGGALLPMWRWIRGDA